MLNLTDDLVILVHFLLADRYHKYISVISGIPWYDTMSSHVCCRNGHAS